jgi:anti-sigma regulatory factor (Ser/Thr protein kinase)
MTERRWRIPRGDFAEAHRSRLEFLAFLRVHAEPESRFDSAEIIYGEVVANAVRHTRTEAIVTLVVDVNVRLLVADDGDSGWRPVVNPAPHDSVRGRGLYIVSTLARELQFASLSPGMLVSIVLPVVPRLPRK